jgi:hypothetical protein
MVDVPPPGFAREPGACPTTPVVSPPPAPGPLVHWVWARVLHPAIEAAQMARPKRIALQVFFTVLPSRECSRVPYARDAAFPAEGGRS